MEQDARRTTDPEARLYRKGKGKEAKLCHMGHALMENRNGLIVDALVTPATGTAKREAAEALLGRKAGRHRARLAGTKATIRQDWSPICGRARHPARRPEHLQPAQGNRRRTTRHPGYAVSQRIRKRIEEAFGWIKTVGGLRKTRHRGTARVGWLFTLTATACNLVRLPKLLAAG